MNTPVDIVTVRIKRLPRRHRIAHLRALLRRQPLLSVRRHGLAALLREQLAMPAAKTGGAP